MGDFVLTVQLIYNQRFSPEYQQMWSLLLLLGTLLCMFKHVKLRKRMKPFLFR
jgi:hypothetical protein